MDVRQLRRDSQKLSIWLVKLLRTFSSKKDLFWRVSLKAAGLVAGFFLYLNLHR